MSPELQRAEIMASYLREIRERIERAALAVASATTNEERITLLRHLSIARKLCDAAIGQDDAARVA